MRHLVWRWVWKLIKLWLSERIAVSLQGIGLPNEPVYYNSQGQVISAEEAGYSAANEEEEEEFVRREGQAQSHENGYSMQE